MTGVTSQTELGNPDLRGWSLLFYVAAGYNISAAVVALLATPFHVQAFFGSGTSLGGPVGTTNTQAFWVSVLLFGVGYVLVARDPSKNHGIVVLAVLGKTFVCALWSWNFIQGTMTLLALLGGLGDLIFAVLFLVFLWRFRRLRVAA